MSIGYHWGTNATAHLRTVLSSTVLRRSLGATAMQQPSSRKLGALGKGAGHERTRVVLSKRDMRLPRP